MKAKRIPKLRRVQRPAQEPGWTPAAPMKVGDKVLLRGKIVEVKKAGP